MINPILKDLLSKLMDKKRANRLGHGGAQYVRNHPWFSSVNWEGIIKKTVNAPFVPILKSEEDVNYFENEFTELEALSPPDIIKSSSMDLGKTYKGFTY